MKIKWYKCELIDKSGTRKHNITVKIRMNQQDLQGALRTAIYRRLEHGKYKNSYHVFWQTWILLEYYCTAQNYLS